MVKGIFIAILTIFLVAGYFAQCHFILNDGKLTPEQYSMLVGQIIGYTSGLASGAVIYWIGTTKSSSEKDGTIASIAKGMSNGTDPK